MRFPQEPTEYNARRNRLWRKHIYWITFGWDTLTEKCVLSESCLTIERGRFQFAAIHCLVVHINVGLWPVSEGGGV